MSSSKRRYSHLPFPEYAHRPGLTPHPNKAGGHSFEAAEKIVSPLENFRIHQDYLWGVDCLNHGYFWEAHIAFEAIWNAHQRQGPIAGLMKALIKIAAAALKHEGNSDEAARGHLLRAQELLQALSSHDLRFAGIDKESLEHWLEQTLAQKELNIKFKLELIF